ncbi:MAG: cadherin repeat domain-containing protein, partial [Cyanobacteria bacterium P01_F01_bin.53]
MTNNSTNNTNGAITIEAEDLNFDNDFFVSGIDSGASGGKIIRVRGDRTDGDIRDSFTGPDGVYDLTLYAYDENDGVGQFTVWVNDQKVNTTLLNKNLGSNLPGALTRFQIGIENLTLKRGDRFRIEAKRGGAEYTSLDKIVFTPKTPPVTEPSKIVLEAEDLNFDNNFFVSGIDRNASNGKIIRVRSNRNSGNVRTAFTGADGVYNLTLDAYDENDGNGRVTVWVNETQVNSTLLNKNLGSRLPDSRTRSQIVINDLQLKRGDQIRIQANRSGAELTSLDKITFDPVASTPINDPVTIISNGGGDFTAVTVDEGQTAVTDFETNVGDANVVYSINAGADQAFFDIDPVTGQLSFKEAPDWEAPADEGRDNVYEVNVIAVGGESGDGQFVSVIVNNL